MFTSKHISNRTANTEEMLHQISEFLQVAKALGHRFLDTTRESDQWSVVYHSSLTSLSLPTCYHYLATNRGT